MHQSGTTAALGEYHCQSSGTLHFWCMTVLLHRVHKCLVLNISHQSGGTTICYSPRSHKPHKPHMYVTRFCFTSRFRHTTDMQTVMLIMSAVWS